MNEDSRRDTAGQPKRRGALLALLVLFLGPLVVSLVIYFGGYQWRPTGTVEHGLLFDPVRPLATVALKAPDGEALGSEVFDGNWTLLQLNNGHCDDVCAQALIDTRQVRLSLGRRMTRVQRVLINDGALSDIDALRALNPDLVIASSDGLSPDWITTFQIDGSNDSPWSLDRVYVVDPIGNLVMIYEPGFELRGLQEDMKRLLRLSRIG